MTAVDVDPAMLERAGRRAAAAGRPAVRRLDARRSRPARSGSGRGRLLSAGVHRLELALPARDARRPAARPPRLARHLAPGGLAVVDVWLPEPSDLARFDGRVILEYVRLEPETGHEVTKLATARYDPDERRRGPDRDLRGGRARRPRPSAGSDGTPCAWSARTSFERSPRTPASSSRRSAASYELEPLGPGSERAILVARRP